GGGELERVGETEGVGVGDRVELTSQMLSATLGPGLLGMIYDGLQNPLKALAERDGFFLVRGKAVAPLDLSRTWTFVPSRKPGERLRAGDVIGTVAEHRFTHKIMIPFAEPGDVELGAIAGGDFTVAEPVAHIVNAAGRQRPVTMAQEGPGRRPLPEGLLRRGRCGRRYPAEPVGTTIRPIHTLFPLPLG